MNYCVDFSTCPHYKLTYIVRYRPAKPRSTGKKGYTLYKTQVKHKYQILVFAISEYQNCSKCLLQIYYQGVAIYS